MSKYKALKKDFDDALSKQKPGDVIKAFEKMGYKFDNIEVKQVMKAYIVRTALDTVMNVAIIITFAILLHPIIEVIAYAIIKGFE